MSEAETSNEHLIYLGLGSNIKPKENIVQALLLLRQLVNIEKVSSVWETPPVGFPNGPNFLNAVVLIRSNLILSKLKGKVVYQIESQLGRQRTANKNAPRPIDLDILIFDGKILDEEIWNRAHWAMPLSELMPDLIHPTRGEYLVTIAQKLSEKTSIRKCTDVNLAHLLRSIKTNKN